MSLPYKRAADHEFRGRNLLEGEVCYNIPTSLALQHRSSLIEKRTRINAREVVQSKHIGNSSHAST